MTAVRERSLVREPALWQAVGNTPLLPVELPDGAGRFWLKAEWMNPGGSVKDRAARSHPARCHPPRTRARPAAARRVERQHRHRLRDAGRGRRRRGDDLPARQRQPGAPGAARGLRGRGRGHRPDGGHRGRRAAGRASWRRPIPTATSTPTSTAIRPTRRPTGRPPGPELWSQTGGRITHFVAAMGTTGTMMGTGGYLKERNAGITLVGVQPDSPYHGLEGLKHLATTSQPPALYDPALPDVVAEIPTEHGRSPRPVAGPERGTAGGLVGGRRGRGGDRHRARGSPMPTWWRSAATRAPAT